MKDDKRFSDAEESTTRRRSLRRARDEENERYEDDDTYDQPDEEYEEDEYEEEYDADEYERDENSDNPDEYEEDEYEEDGYDEESPDEEDEYDDVFSLKDDLKREQRKQFIQYICVAVGALAIIAIALFASVKLTHNRIEEEKNAAILAQKALEEQLQAQQTAGDVPVQVTLNAWPSSQFPSIPQFESEAYETTVMEGYAKVMVPSSATLGYNDYIDALCGERNAKLYIKTNRLSVIELDGVEIHLVTGNQQNRVVLCDEKQLEFNDVDYRAFDLPTGFKLVSVKADSATGRVLTYRLVTVDKALEYANSLVNQYGWKILGSFDMNNHAFYAVYSKNNLQMTLDYYSSSDDFTIKLDYVS